VKEFSPEKTKLETRNEEIIRARIKHKFMGRGEHNYMCQLLLPPPTRVRKESERNVAFRDVVETVFCSLADLPLARRFLEAKPS
jgi:hypothetical protein